MRFEIRFHEPQFARSAVSEYFGIRRLPSWVSSKPNWRDIQKLQKEYRPPFVPANWPQLFKTLSPDFKLTRYGLYLLDPQATDYIPSRFAKDGRFLCEGCNHIHLHGIVKNPVAQYALGIAAIRNWMSLLKQFDSLSKVVVYLNDGSLGRSRDFILCPYSNPSQAEIRRLETDWPPVSVQTGAKFLSWALR